MVRKLLLNKEEDTNMKKNYMAPQCEQVVLNVSEEILDGHFGNQSGVPVEPSTGGSGTQGNTGSGVDGFEAKESEWGEVYYSPWED
jgi:hypothetical protein